MFRSAIAGVMDPQVQIQEQVAEERPASTAPAADEFHQVVQQAKSWEDRGAILDRVQAAFDAGHIDQEVAEDLALQTANQSRQLPERGPAAGELRLCDLFKENPIRWVRSRVLGETVIFAADGVELPADLEGVVYRESELRQMPGRPPEQVRAIHATKKAFDGELIP